MILHAAKNDDLALVREHLKHLGKVGPQMVPKLLNGELWYFRRLGDRKTKILDNLQKAGSLER